MKSYTDIEQSKKLAEILPIESADMHYVRVYFEDKQSDWFVKLGRPIKSDDIIPCWSLAALLDLLPNEIITDNRLECRYQINIRKYDSGSNTTLYQIAYGNNRGSSGSWHDMVNTGEKEHLIDACFQILINLNELKIL